MTNYLVVGNNAYYNYYIAISIPTDKGLSR